MIKQGDSYQLDLSFTQQQVNAFAEITGDKNPIHIDAEYAAQTFFGKPIVHGFLAGSVFSKVFGMLFPGEGTIYMYQDMKFMAPVFVDKNYTAKFEVIEVNTQKHNAVIKCLLTDDEEKLCIEGTARVKHNKEFI